MNNKEFIDLMKMLIEEIKRVSIGENFICSLSSPELTNFNQYKTCILEVTLNNKNYTTIERFNNSMTFEESDLSKIAVELLTSFYRDYFYHKSIKDINK